MLYFGLGLLAAAALGGLIYVFLNKKTPRTLKIAALIAIILSGLALGICGIIIFSANNGDESEETQYTFTPSNEPAERESNLHVTELVIFLIVLLAALGFIIYLGIRDRNKRLGKTAPPKKDDSDSDFDDLDDL